MLKPVILFRDDYASEPNSVEAHIIFKESNHKTTAQVKAAGFGYDKIEAVGQLIEGLNAAKEAIDGLIAFAKEVESLQREEEKEALGSTES